MKQKNKLIGDMKSQLDFKLFMDFPIEFKKYMIYVKHLKF